MGSLDEKVKITPKIEIEVGEYAIIEVMKNGVCLGKCMLYPEKIIYSFERGLTSIDFNITKIE